MKNLCPLCFLEDNWKYEKIPDFGIASNWCTFHLHENLRQARKNLDKVYEVEHLLDGGSPKELMMNRWYVLHMERELERRAE